jgi:hypothetical protein
MHESMFASCCVKFSSLGCDLKRSASDRDERTPVKDFGYVLSLDKQFIHIWYPSEQMLSSSVLEVLSMLMAMWC